MEKVKNQIQLSLQEDVNFISNINFEHESGKQGFKFFTFLGVDIEGTREIDYNWALSTIMKTLHSWSKSLKIDVLDKYTGMCDLGGTFNISDIFIHPSTTPIPVITTTPKKGHWFKPLSIVSKNQNSDVPVIAPLFLQSQKTQPKKSQSVMAPLFALPIPDEEGQQSKDFLVQSSSYTHASYTPNSSLESADNKMTFLSPDTGAVDIKVTNQNELQTADDSTSQENIKNLENDNKNDSSLITQDVSKF